MIQDKIKTVTMQEMADWLLSNYYPPEQREKRKFYKADVQSFYNNRGKWPTIRVVYTPFFANRNYSKVVLYNVNNCGESHIGQRAIDKNADWLPNPFATLEVYDTDLSAITDPRVSIEDIPFISPGEVLVVHQKALIRRTSRYDGPRVVDDHVRKRINEYFENDNLGHFDKEEGRIVGAENKIDVKHFMGLRKAATNKKASPGFGGGHINTLKKI